MNKEQIQQVAKEFLESANYRPIYYVGNKDHVLNVYDLCANFLQSMIEQEVVVTKDKYEWLRNNYRIMSENLDYHKHEHYKFRDNITYNQSTDLKKNN